MRRWRKTRLSNASSPSARLGRSDRRHRTTGAAERRARHRRFGCRHESLNQWLRRRALANAATGVTRTYVVCAEGRQVVGYYALAAGSITIESAPARLRRNMPDPLPVIVLGRLAVAEPWCGRGIGSGLLKDAILRALQASEIIGACALLCHAIDDEAKAFYIKHGFVHSPIQQLTMMLGLRR